jgi:hypothetical protein
VGISKLDQGWKEKAEDMDGRGGVEMIGKKKKKKKSPRHS